VSRDGNKYQKGVNSIKLYRRLGGHLNDNQVEGVNNQTIRQIVKKRSMETTTKGKEKSNPTPISIKITSDNTKLKIRLEVVKVVNMRTLDCSSYHMSIKKDKKPSITKCRYAMTRWRAE
jgi:hypothetical protein